MSEIKSYILLSGHTIIGVVKSEDINSVVLENALAIGLQPNPQPGQVGLQFGSICPIANDDGKGINVTISKSGLIEFDIKPEVLGHYEQMIGKLSIAPASALVSLDKFKK